MLSKCQLILKIWKIYDIIYIDYWHRNIIKTVIWYPPVEYFFKIHTISRKKIYGEIHSIIFIIVYSCIFILCSVLYSIVWSHSSLHNSSQGCPLPSQSACVFVLFLPTKASLCCPNILCVAFHWSVNSVPRSISWKETSPFFSGIQELPRAPRLGV